MFVNAKPKTRPEPYDGKKTGVWGVCEGLMIISKQIDYALHLYEMRNLKDELEN